MHYSTVNMTVNNRSIDYKIVVLLPRVYKVFRNRNFSLSTVLHRKQSLGRLRTSYDVWVDGEGRRTVGWSEEICHEKLRGNTFRIQGLFLLLKETSPCDSVSFDKPATRDERNFYILNFPQFIFACSQSCWEKKSDKNLNALHSTVHLTMFVSKRDSTIASDNNWFQKCSTSSCVLVFNAMSM